MHNLLKLKPSCKASLRIREHPKVISIDDVLGVGGQGTVFKGTILHQGRKVTSAIKSYGSSQQDNFDSTTIGSDIYKSMYARWMSEFNNLQQLEEVKGVRQTYWIEESAIQPFYCLEYLEGNSLEDELRYFELEKRLGDTDYGFIKDYVSHIVKALHTLEQVHEERIVHYDLKPANIIINKKKDKVTIIDFGASYEIQEVHEEGRIIGTPNYMSSEQITNKPRLPRNDIFAVGAMLYRVLHPQGFTPMQLYTRIRGVSCDDVFQNPELFNDFRTNITKLDSYRIYNEARKAFGIRGAGILVETISQMLTCPKVDETYYHQADQVIKELTSLNSPSIKKVPRAIKGIVRAAYGYNHKSHDTSMQYRQNNNRSSNSELPTSFNN